MSFIFNECDMCENPEEENIYSGPEGSVTISLAERDGLWCYGYDYSFKNPIWGGGSAAGFGEYRKTFSSREEAFDAAVKKMASHIMGKYPKIAARISEPRQLLLFSGAA